ncbi:hypothetical protein ISN45_At01g062890, partial [Arabidopsis thaliana x Arabidopsis arenosa]
KKKPASTKKKKKVKKAITGPLVKPIYWVVLFKAYWVIKLIKAQMWRCGSSWSLLVSC